LLAIDRRLKSDAGRTAKFAESCQPAKFLTFAPPGSRFEDRGLPGRRHLATSSRRDCLQACAKRLLQDKGQAMNGKLFGLMAMALIAASVGCKMCQTPYDYCAATIGPDGQPTGGFMTRQGSVLGGMPGVPVYQSQPTLAPQSAMQSAAPAGAAHGVVVPASATSEPVAADAEADAH
jgi:hypothetical protein